MGNTSGFTFDHIKLNGLTLKTIALVTMIVDHIGYIVFPHLIVLRIIGRIAFPIYAFLAAEGALHSRNIGKYLLRIFIFAAMSEPVFDLAFFGRLYYPDYQNVFFTLGLGIAAIWLTEKPPAALSGIPVYLRGAAAGIIACLAAWGLDSDYGAYGVIVIFIFYMFRDRLYIALIGAELIFIAMGSIEWLAFLGLIPLLFYSGRRGYGGKPLQYLFYAAYPLHLLLIHFISVYTWR
ncbi:MAG: conjugal transfer protein TraX [Lachnospiraceae bacterium]|nr:conjugal transfer protein TraX [Lachnospiraceae bacterium]